MFFYHLKKSWNFLGNLILVTPMILVYSEYVKICFTYYRATLVDFFRFYVFVILFSIAEVQKVHFVNYQFEFDKHHNTIHVERRTTSF